MKNINILNDQEILDICGGAGIGELISGAITAAPPGFPGKLYDRNDNKQIFGQIVSDLARNDGPILG